MTIYGLIATVLICATVIICIAMLISQPFKVEFIRKTEAQATPVVAPKPNTELEKDLNNVEKASLDAVIRAANELMGIDMEDVNEQAE